MIAPDARATAAAGTETVASGIAAEGSDGVVGGVAGVPVTTSTSQ